MFTYLFNLEKIEIKGFVVVGRFIDKKKIWLDHCDVFHSRFPRLSSFAWFDLISSLKLLWTCAAVHFCVKFVLVFEFCCCCWRCWRCWRCYLGCCDIDTCITAWCYIDVSFVYHFHLTHVYFVTFYLYIFKFPLIAFRFFVMQCSYKKNFLFASCFVLLLLYLFMNINTGVYQSMLCAFSGSRLSKNLKRCVCEQCACHCKVHKYLDYIREPQPSTTVIYKILLFRLSPFAFSRSVERILWILFVGVLMPLVVHLELYVFDLWYFMHSYLTK